MGHKEELVGHKEEEEGHKVPTSEHYMVRVIRPQLGQTYLSTRQQIRRLIIRDILTIQRQGANQNYLNLFLAFFKITNFVFMRNPQECK